MCSVKFLQICFIHRSVELYLLRIYRFSIDIFKKAGKFDQKSRNWQNIPNKNKIIPNVNCTLNKSEKQIMRSLDLNELKLLINHSIRKNK